MIRDLEESTVMFVDHSEVSLRKSPLSNYGIDEPNPSDKRFKNKCAFCEKVEPRRNCFKTCYRCRSLGIKHWHPMYHLYCGKECQTSHWKRHKVEHMLYEAVHTPPWEKDESTVNNENVTDKENAGTVALRDEIDDEETASHETRSAPAPGDKLEPKDYPSLSNDKITVVYVNDFPPLDEDKSYTSDDDTSSGSDIGGSNMYIFTGADGKNSAVLKKRKTKDRKDYNPRVLFELDELRRKRAKKLNKPTITEVTADEVDALAAKFNPKYLAGMEKNAKLTSSAMKSDGGKISEKKSGRSSAKGKKKKNKKSRSISPEIHYDDDFVDQFCSQILKEEARIKELKPSLEDGKVAKILKSKLNSIISTKFEQQKQNTNDKIENLLHRKADEYLGIVPKMKAIEQAEVKEKSEDMYKSDSEDEFVEEVEIENEDIEIIGDDDGRRWNMKSSTLFSESSVLRNAQSDYKIEEVDNAEGELNTQVKSEHSERSEIEPIAQPDPDGRDNEKMQSSSLQSIDNRKLSDSYAPDESPLSGSSGDLIHHEVGEIRQERKNTSNSSKKGGFAKKSRKRTSAQRKAKRAEVELKREKLKEKAVSLSAELIGKGPSEFQVNPKAKQIIDAVKSMGVTVVANLHGRPNLILSEEENPGGKCHSKNAIVVQPLKVDESAEYNPISKRAQAEMREKGIYRVPGADLPDFSNDENLLNPKSVADMKPTSESTVSSEPILEPAPQNDSIVEPQISSETMQHMDENPVEHSELEELDEDEDEQEEDEEEQEEEEPTTDAAVAKKLRNINDVIHHSKPRHVDYCMGEDPNDPTVIFSNRQSIYVERLDDMTGVSYIGLLLSEKPNNLLTKEFLTLKEAAYDGRDIDLAIKRHLIEINDDGDPLYEDYLVRKFKLLCHFREQFRKVIAEVNPTIETVESSMSSKGASDHRIGTFKVQNSTKEFGDIYSDEAEKQMSDAPSLDLGKAFSTDDLPDKEKKEVEEGVKKLVDIAHKGNQRQSNSRNGTNKKHDSRKRTNMEPNEKNVYKVEPGIFQYRILKQQGHLFLVKKWTDYYYYP